MIVIRFSFASKVDSLQLRSSFANRVEAYTQTYRHTASLPSSVAFSSCLILSYIPCAHSRGTRTSCAGQMDYTHTAGTKTNNGSQKRLKAHHNIVTPQRRNKPRRLLPRTIPHTPHAPKKTNINPSLAERTQPLTARSGHCCAPTQTPPDTIRATTTTNNNNFVNHAFCSFAPPTPNEKKTYLEHLGEEVTVIGEHRHGRRGAGWQRRRPRGQRRCPRRDEPHRRQWRHPQHPRRGRRRRRQKRRSRQHGRRQQGHRRLGRRSPVGARGRTRGGRVLRTTRGALWAVPSR